MLSIIVYIGVLPEILNPWIRIFRASEGRFLIMSVVRPDFPGAFSWLIFAMAFLCHLLLACF